jgi:hypothetical protein
MGFSSNSSGAGNSGALRVLYNGIKDSTCSLAADGFLQSNPGVVTTLSAKSTTIPASVKRGVLGGSVAFGRPDQGQGVVGGPVLNGSAFIAKTRPLGLFVNDAIGNGFENSPAVASGKNPYLRGGTVADRLYETAVQTTTGSGTVGTALVWAVGDFVYGSVNGYLTNRWQDSYEAQWINVATSGSGASGVATEPDIRRLGVVTAVPDSTSSELVVQLAALLKENGLNL